MLSGEHSWNNNLKEHELKKKSVGENEANTLRFVLTLSPPGKVKVNESGIQWYMVEVNGAYKHG